MKLIKLTQGQHAMVDDEDFAWLNRFKWTAHITKRPNGDRVDVCREFSVTSKAGQPMECYLSMAALLMGMKPGYVADHKDRNPLNNQKANLRWATRNQNAINWWRTHGEHGRGVFKNCKGQFTARITVGQRRVCLGTFDTAALARAAYDAAALKHHGQFAMLNRDHFKTKGTRHVRTWNPK